MLQTADSVRSRSNLNDGIGRAAGNRARSYPTWVTWQMNFGAVGLVG